MHKITAPIEHSRQLTQAVLQVIDLLGMYQAELARILGLQCSDIGDMAAAKQFIVMDSEAGKKASLLVRLYNLLYDRFSGDEALMCHWFRRHDDGLSGAPFYLIVDEHKLEAVISFLEQH